MTYEIQRGTQGHFIEGVSANPGGRRRKPSIDYVGLMRTHCTADKWTSIINTAIAQAIKGNSRARQFLAGYLLGSPTQYLKVEPVDNLVDSRAFIDEYEAMARRVYGGDGDGDGHSSVDAIADHSSDNDG